MIPKISGTKDFIFKSVIKCLPAYRFEQDLKVSIFIVHNVNTNDTQLVHRIRLRLINPKYEFEDLKDIDPNILTQSQK